MNDRAEGSEFVGCRAPAARSMWSRRRMGVGPVGRAVSVLSAAVPVAVLLCSPASADPGVLSTSCGAPISSTVKRGVDMQQTIASNNVYVNVTGAGVKVNVPAGQTRCVRVRFSANLTCDSPSDVSHCYVKVADDLSPFLWDPSVALATHEAGGAHSYEWASRLSAGSHVIRIQATKNTGVTFMIHHWTMAVDIAK